MWNIAKIDTLLAPFIGIAGAIFSPPLSQQALAGDSMSLVTLDFNKQTVILR
jgi:hypothetical protein